MTLKHSFTADCYHPIWESVEAILTLSLYYRWVIGTARLSKVGGITERWATRVYSHKANKPVDIHHAAGQGITYAGLVEGETKLQLCERLNAKYIVEDNPYEIAHFVRSGSQVEPICIPYRYNKWIADEFPEVVRAPYPEITQHLLRKLG